MSTLAAVRVPTAPVVATTWRSIAWPKEHGSWSLALEPLAFGILVAPSWPGAALALAAMAGFFARRPLRTAFTDPNADRRTVGWRVTGVLALVAVLAATGAFAAASLTVAALLAPTVVAAGVFLTFDLRKSGREQAAEVAGALAFGWLPAVFAGLAGRPVALSIAIGFVMLLRSVPTVLIVRRFIRDRKTDASRMPWILALPIAAAAGAFAIARAGLAPWTVAVLALILALRAAVLLLARPALRASTLGMIEAVVGLTYVVACACAWRF